LEALDRCASRVDELKNGWVEIAAKQTRNGDAFVYAKDSPVRRLLQEPLEVRANMDANRLWFIAARSMRDTEPVTLLKLRTPDGRPFD